MKLRLLMRVAFCCRQDGSFAFCENVFQRSLHNHFGLFWYDINAIVFLGKFSGCGHSC